jgi:hypothetical protein
MIKKQNTATVYLTGLLLVSVVFFTLLLNQLLTSDTVPTEEKQPAIREQETAVTEEESTVPIEKETEDKTEKEPKGHDVKPAYVADWFEKSKSPVTEEDPESVVNEQATKEPTEKPIEKQTVEEKLVEEPRPPVVEKPGQPSVEEIDVE